MMKASRLLLILLVAGAAASCSATAAEAHPDGAAGELTSSAPGFPWWRSIVPVVGDSKIQECWGSLLGGESCVASVLQSIHAGRLVLSSECCAAVAEVGEDCILKMFSFLPSGDLIPGLIKRVCAAFAPPAGPTANKSGRRNIPLY